MSNLRFYSAEHLQIGATAQLSDNAAAHATRVLRLRVDDDLTLFDGSGVDFLCTINDLQKNAVFVTVKSSAKVLNESPLNITLLLGISAGDRMDIAMQKAVELGVNKIIPIKTERSVVKLDDAKAKKRVEHWQNVVIAACEQSGRAMLPLVELPMTLSQFCAQPVPSKILRITLDPLAKNRLADIAKPDGEIQLLVGAEGGLSPKEIAMSVSEGFAGVQLGKRILRTETAPLAAITAMNTIWGDF